LLRPLYPSADRDSVLGLLFAQGLFQWGKTGPDGATTPSGTLRRQMASQPPPAPCALAGARSQRELLLSPASTQSVQDAVLSLKRLATTTEDGPICRPQLALPKRATKRAAEQDGRASSSATRPRLGRTTPIDKQVRCCRGSCRVDLTCLQLTFLSSSQGTLRRILSPS